MAGVDEEQATRQHGASAFFDAVQDLLVADDGTFRLLGSQLEIAEHLRDLPARTHTRVWSMAERSTLGSLRRGHEETMRSVERGVDCRSLMSPFAVRVRLVTSFLRAESSPCRIILVPGSMLLADDVLLVAGRRGSPISTTIWRTEDPEVVRQAAAAFEDVWSAARPIEEVALLPALEERELMVALGMIDGDTDREIADRLGIAPRTVQVLVRRIIDWCGARNRTHAVALLAGSDA
ncbi:LuxR C-terminal-related transcriptional regulator [Oryzobacter terrae]|uniref:helix-turn-helix transcriptional regulator n=1 Tax=Oryzobacter terrae TaxID=1620385 RepID=UPI00366A817A